MPKAFRSPLVEEVETDDEAPEETSLHRDHVRFGCSNPDCWMCGNAEPSREENQFDE